MAFPYTYTLTAGQPENIGHVQQNFTDVGTVVEGQWGAYRTISQVAAGRNSTTAFTAGDYFFQADGSVRIEGSGAGAAPVVLVYLDDADYTISGRTPKLRVRAQFLTNATAPTNTVTFGLFPLSSVAGGSDVLVPTLGTVVSGSTVAFAAQGASTVGQGNSGDFSFPSDGTYALGVTSSGATAVNAAVAMNAQLQVRWV